MISCGQEQAKYPLLAFNGSCAIVDTAQWQLCNWAHWLLKKCIFFLISPWLHQESIEKRRVVHFVVLILKSRQRHIYAFISCPYYHVCALVQVSWCIIMIFDLLSKYSMCAGLMSGWGCRDGSPGGGDESIHSANHSPAYMCVQPLSNVYIGYIVRYGMVW